MMDIHTRLCQVKNWLKRDQKHNERLWDDFIGYCSVRFMQGTSFKTDAKFLWYDFLRGELGRGDKRGRGFERENKFDLDEIPTSCFEDRVIKKDQLEVMYESLPVKYQKVFRMIAEGANDHEIGKACGVTPAGAWVRKQKMRELISHMV